MIPFTTQKVPVANLVSNQMDFCRDPAWSVVVQQFLHVPYPEAFWEQEAGREDATESSYHPG